MVNILIEKDNNILSMSVKNLINDDIKKEIERLEKESEDVDSVQDDSFETYTFLNGEVAAKYEDGNYHVLTHRPYVNKALTYDNLQGSLRRRSYSNPEYTWITTLSETVFSDILSFVDKTSPEVQNMLSIMAKHFEHTKDKINYKRRLGSAILTKYHNLRPNSVFETKIFDMTFDRPSLTNSRTYFSKAQGSMLDNLYDLRGVCWGAVPLSTANGKDLYVTGANILNMFQGSTFNADLSIIVNLDLEALELEIKRTYNDEHKTGYTDAEFETMRSTFLDVLGKRLQSSGKYCSLMNTQVLAILSLFNLDSEWVTISR